MRMIDADALIEFCAERWIPLNIDAVNMQPTIQPEKAQHSQRGATSDLISRQQALKALIYAVKNVGVLDANDIRTVFKALPTIQPVATDTNVGDTISRQSALEKVRAMQTYKLFMGDDMILVDKAEVQTELMMLPSAQPEQQWIPCEDCERRCKRWGNLKTLQE